LCKLQQRTFDFSQHTLTFSGGLGKARDVMPKKIVAVEAPEIVYHLHPVLKGL